MMKMFWKDTSFLERTTRTGGWTGSECQNSWKASTSAFPCLLWWFCFWFFASKFYSVMPFFVSLTRKTHTQNKRKQNIFTCISVYVYLYPLPNQPRRSSRTNGKYSCVFTQHLSVTQSKKTNKLVSRLQSYVIVVWYCAKWLFPYNSNLLTIDLAAFGWSDEPPAPPPSVWAPPQSVAIFSRTLQYATKLTEKFVLRAGKK